MEILNELPSDHSNRTRPLVGCRYRWRQGKTWKEIKPTFKIATRCFNDLGPAWTDHDVFTFDKDS